MRTLLLTLGLWAISAQAAQPLQTVTALDVDYLPAADHADNKNRLDIYIRSGQPTRPWSSIFTVAA